MGLGLGLGLGFVRRRSTSPVGGVEGGARRAVLAAGCRPTEPLHTR